MSKLANIPNGIHQNSLTFPRRQRGLGDKFLVMNGHFSTNEFMQEHKNTSLADTQKMVSNFRQARSVLDATLADLCKQATRLGPASEAQQRKLNACRRAVDDDQAECGVIGGEGVGKSTLVNAAIGELREIVPTERFMPGTVAPIHVRYGRGEPNYVVILQKAGNEIRKEDLSPQEFQKYALQRYNRNNEKCVVRLEIYLDNPLLIGGIAFVDIPGGEGTSTDVALETRDFISKREHAIIGVVRERSGYGALKRLLTVDGEIQWDRVGALIYNTTKDSLEGNGRIDEKLEGIRSGFVESIAQDLDRDLMAELRSRTYVTNLRDLATGQSPKGPEEAALYQEGKLALEQVAKVIETRSLNAVLRRGVKTTLKAIDLFGDAVQRRQRVIKALLEGESGATEVCDAMAAITQAKQVALANWQAEEASSSCREFDKALSERIKLESSRTRDRILTQLGKLKSEWEYSDQHNKVALKNLQQRAEEVFTENIHQFRELWAQTFLQSMEHRAARRTKLATEALTSIKFFSGITARTTDKQWERSETAPIFTVDHADDVDTAMRYSAKLAAVAVNLASSGVGTNFAWIAGAGAALAGAYAALRQWDRGGDKGAGLTLMQDAIGKAVSLPTPETEAEDWERNVQDMAVVSRSMLKHDLEELENLLIQPVGREAELKKFDDELSAIWCRIEVARKEIRNLVN